MKRTSSTSASEMTNETSINSKYHSLTSFIDNLVGIPELAEEKFKGATIMLDTSMYQNDYGVNVRPIQVVFQTEFRKTVLNMESLIKQFDGIPYIRVNETKYRRLTRDPSIIVIDTSIKKQYENHDYYDYKIVKLFLRDELSHYESVSNKAHEVMKSYLNHQKVKEGEIEL